MTESILFYEYNSCGEASPRSRKAGFGISDTYKTFMYNMKLIYT